MQGLGNPFQLAVAGELYPSWLLINDDEVRPIPTQMGVPGEGYCQKGTPMIQTAW